MAYYLSPVFQDAQFVSATTDFAVNYKLYTYLAGTTTAVTTYQDNAGSASHANPIILNARGEPPAPIWLASGAAVKFVLKTDADVTVRTIDNVYGIGDTAVASTGSATQEWEAFNGTPTYVNSTSFTVTGNQTSTLAVGRRVKMTISGGTSYSTIVSSAYTTLTTVTIDTTGSSGLDSSINALTSFSVGILTPANHSLPLITDQYPIRSGSSDKTKKLSIEVDNVDTGTTVTWTASRFSGVPMLSEYSDVNYNANLKASISSGALLLELKTNSNVSPSSTDTVSATFRQLSVPYATSKTISSALTLTCATASSLGTASSVASKIWVCLVWSSTDDSIQLGAILPRSIDSSGNITGLKKIRNNDFYASTTAEGSGSATSALVLYTTNAVTNAHIKILGYALATWNGSQWSSVGHYSTFFPSMPLPGEVAQIVRSENVAYTSGTTTIPNDDTIPTSSEGNQIIGSSLTPTNPANAILTTCSGTFAISGAGEIITVDITDGSAAIAAAQTSQNSADPQFVALDSFRVITSSSTINRSFRAGGTSGANTLSVNGHSGGRKLGGAMNAYLELKEIVL